VSRHPEPILHVDMDAFYASVEQRDDPDLAGRPVAVGAASGRGVVAAASYEARAAGVRSAMPMVRARRLCPDLVVVPPRFDRYHEVSDALMAILRDVTPLVEPLALDEAFLDVAGAVGLFGPPATIGADVRARVRRELDLPCSVGVGPTKSVAKLLSGLAKPDGLLHWPTEEVVARLRPLPVGHLWGAGPRTVERLAAYGLTRIGEVADTDRTTLQRLVGDALGAQLHDLARGHDPRPVLPSQEARSISAETTFDADVDDPAVLDRRLLALSTRVARRLRRGDLLARTVTLKVRFADHTDVTRSRTLPEATDRTRDVVAAARALLLGLHLERVRVRLLGVRCSGLVPVGAAGPTQPRLLDPVEGLPGEAIGPGGRWGALDRAADAIAARYGTPAVSYAALLDGEGDGEGGSDGASAGDPPPAGDGGPGPGVRRPAGT
jgi:DNA polymerase-4